MQNFDAHALREEVERQVQLQKKIGKATFFIISLVMFVLLSLISVGIISSVPATATPETTGAIIGAAVMMGSGWATSIMFHGLSLLLDNKAAEQSFRDRVGGRLIARQFLEEAAQKQKRDDAPETRYELRDDGEIALAPDVVTDEQHAEKRASS